MTAPVHRLAVAVYHEDTDFTGSVYHANYLKFCERGRTEWLRAGGSDHAALAEAGTFLVVRRMVCDFHRPARIGDALTVETRLERAAGARLELAQQVVRGGEVVFAAAVTIAAAGADGRPRRLPAAVAAMAAAVDRGPEPT